jgi:predicted MFS family arabinose efflux permease
MGGDQQERVDEAPPVRLGQILADGLRERRQGGHQRPVLGVLLDRTQFSRLLSASLTATAVGYFLLFTSSSLARALPAAGDIGMFGTMSEVIPQTAIQRVIPDAVLGRVSAAFVTGEAAATLAGAVAGPFLAQAVRLPGMAATASLLTLTAAALTVKGRKSLRFMPFGSPPRVHRGQG